MDVGEIIAVLETVAPDRECHAFSPSCAPDKATVAASRSPAYA
jgi:hypothetical protein